MATKKAKSKAPVTEQEQAKDLIVKLIRRRVYEYRKDITRWTLAKNEAKNLDRPRRFAMHDLFADIVLDGHVTAVTETRLLRVLNTSFTLVDAKGKVDEVNTALIKKSWAIQCNYHALQSKFHGYSLIFFDRKGSNEIKECRIVSRYHVIPEEKAVLLDTTGEEKIYFTNPPYTNFYLGVGEPDDFGLLNKAAPHFIFKKSSLGNWSKFQELFGIPIRTAKTASRDPQVQAEIVKWLEETGAAGYGLFPEGTTLELIQANNAGASGVDIFDKAVDRANSEISKLVLLQTMTTDDGSSRSQGEVHERKEDEVILADYVFLEFLWNDQILPLLRKHGYNISEDHRFVFDKQKKLTLTALWDIANGLITQGYIIPESYLQDTFGIPIEGRNEPMPQLPGGGPPNFNNRSAKVTLSAMDRQIFSLYNNPHRHEFTNAGGLNFKSILSVVEKVFNGTYTPGDIDPDLQKAQFDFLMKGIGEGYGVDIDEVDYSTPDLKKLKFMRDNVFVFSTMKNYNQLKAMSDLLLDDEGKVRAFADFKKLALQINERYNVNYLSAEYNHAVGSSQMAARWQTFEKEKKSLPMLRYETVGDDRVRPEHEALDGITLPVGHAFWNKYYPPNSWGCRCDVVQAPAGRATSEDRITYPEVNAMFQNNVGKSGIVFPDKHPYFNASGDDKKKIKEYLKNNKPE